MAETIMVEIFGGSCGSSCASCGGSCSTAGSGAEIEKEAGLLAEEVKKQYGQMVNVQYIDTDQKGLSQFPMVSRVVQAGYSFPIIAVNGKPRLAGAIDLESLRQILDEENN